MRSAPDGRGEKRRGGGKMNGRRGGRGGRGRLFDYGELRLLMLAMIVEKPRHGYELIKEISERFEGRYTPSPGVIYPALSWLEEMGYITLAAEDGKRKESRITAEGEAFLAANRQAADDLLTRKPPRKPEDDLTDVVVTAMNQLKSALRIRLEGGQLSDEELSVIAGHIKGAATAIAPTATLARSATDGSPADKDRNMEQIITRHRQEPKRRTLNVTEVQNLTPHMIRVQLAGEELKDFQSLSPDDHIKLFFDIGAEKPAMRDYTPRAYDNEARTLTLDFAVHEAGPATAWAMAAKPGDTLNVGGPRGSAVVAPVFDWYLLIGDETALPAIGRRVEELPDGVEVITLTGVPEAADEQLFETAANHSAHWVHRPVEAAADASPMLEALKGITWPEGKGFVWIAAEAKVARALRDYVLNDIGHPAHWMKASGYWTEGVADGSSKRLD